MPPEGGEAPKDEAAVPGRPRRRVLMRAKVAGVDRRNRQGETPLLRAVQEGDVAGVRRLLQQGADVRIPCFAGWTPLHEAGA